MKHLIYILIITITLASLPISTVFAMTADEDFLSSVTSDEAPKANVDKVEVDKSTEEPNTTTNGITTTSEELAQPPSITSQSAILFEANTGSILFEQNADQIMYPASLTKIATAIYAIETAHLEDIVTVSMNARHAAGTRVYLELGEQMSMKQLLQGLLINSGNDAGIAIAEQIAGSEQQFAADLTDFIHDKIGATNTNFTNATGLFDEAHTTTAKDLALITQYAMHNAFFMELFGTVQLNWEGLTWRTTLVSHNRLVNGEIAYDGITGGKTGYVPESKYTLATTAERGDLHLIAIVLGGSSKGIYTDTKTLFNYGFQNFEQATIDAEADYSPSSYSTPQTITYVKQMNETTSVNITPAGYLQIVGTQGNIIKVAPLTTAVSKEPATNEIMKSSLEPIVLTDHPNYRTSLIWMGILAIAGIFVFSRSRG